MLSERLRLAQELEAVGYTVTSYERLGIPFDISLAGELSVRAEVSEGSQKALDVVKHIDKDAMTIVQDDHCMEIGRRLVEPVVGAIFKESPEARAAWSLFGLNRYQRGGRFGAHRDEVGATVMVVTVSGARDFAVFKTQPDSAQVDLTDIEATFNLQQASVMILDGEKDPGHAVIGTPDSSIVAVADVPYKLRLDDAGKLQAIPLPPPPPLETT